MSCDKCAGYRHRNAMKLEVNSIFLHTVNSVQVFQQFSFENGRLVPIWLNIILTVEISVEINCYKVWICFLFSTTSGFLLDV